MVEPIGRSDLILDTDDRRLRRGVKGAHDKARGLESQFKKVTAALVGIGTAAIAFRSLSRFVGESIEKFKIQEDAEVSLRSALIQTGKTGVDAFRMIADEAARLQRVTDKADEALIKASSTLSLLAPSLSATELANAQKAIIGIADVFLKGDVLNSAQLLGKTLGSTTNALTRYGIQVDVSATQGEKLAQVLAQTSGMFAVSQARAETLAGRQRSFANAFGDFQEALGRAVIQGANVAQILDNITEKIRSITEKLGPIITGLRLASAFFHGGTGPTPTPLVGPPVPSPEEMAANIKATQERLGREAEGRARALRQRRFLRGGLPVTTPGGGPELRPTIITPAIPLQLPELPALEELNTFSKRLAANFQNVSNIMANQFTGGLTSAIFGLQSFSDALKNFALQLAQQAVGGFIRSLIPLPGFSVAPVPTANLSPSSIRFSIDGEHLQTAAFDLGIVATSPQLVRLVQIAVASGRFGGAP